MQVELKGDPGRNDATHAIAKSRSSSSSNVEEIYCDAHMLCKVNYLRVIEATLA